MLQGYAEKEEGEYEKLRILCYYSANTMFWKKPARSITDIFGIKSIDGTGEDRIEALKNKIEKKRALLRGEA